MKEVVEPGNAAGVRTVLRDLPFALDSGGIVGVQGTAEKDPFNETQFIDLLELASKGIAELTKLNRLAIGKS